MKRKDTKKSSGTLKWDETETFLTYIHPNGRVEELFVEEAEKMKLKIPPHSEEYLAEQRAKEAQPKTQSRPEDTKSSAKVAKTKYDVGSWQKLIHLNHFLRSRERILLIPRLEKISFDMKEASLGYYSCVLETIFVFKDYFWAFNSNIRLSLLDEYSEVFARYCIKDRNMGSLKIKVRAALGDVIVELRKWGKLLGFDPLSADSVCQLTKLMMNEGFSGWLKVHATKGLIEASGNSRPSSLQWFCQYWREHEAKNARERNISNLP